MRSRSIPLVLVALTVRCGGSARPPLRVMPRPARVPLSYAQQRLWFLNRFDGGGAAYNMPAAFRVSGALDVEAAASHYRRLERTGRPR